jgi:hypothetical protein
MIQEETVHVRINRPTVSAAVFTNFESTALAL